MKLVTKYTDNGVQFERTQKDGKIVVVASEQFIAPMETDKALDSLKHEVSQRGNVTRAALSCLVHIFNSPRLDGYKGIGDINADGGMPKEVKTALRASEESYFAPMFKDTKKLDLFLTSIRDAGIYATAKGVALKYFFYADKLPCHYAADTPQTDKLLSVSAMQKLLSNMQEEKQPEDKSIARQVLELQAAFEAAEGLTRDQMLAILGNLKTFAGEVQQAINTVDSEATDIAPALLPAKIAALDNAILREFERIEQEAGVALM
jgi:hypothetical protein